MDASAANPIVRLDFSDQPRYRYACECVNPDLIRTDDGDGKWSLDCPTHGQLAWGIEGPHVDLGITRE